MNVLAWLKKNQKTKKLATNYNLSEYNWIQLMQNQVKEKSGERT